MKIHDKSVKKGKSTDFSFDAGKSVKKCSCDKATNFNFLEGKYTINLLPRTQKILPEIFVHCNSFIVYFYTTDLESSFELYPLFIHYIKSDL